MLDNIISSKMLTIYGGAYLGMSLSLNHSKTITTNLGTISKYNMVMTTTRVDEFDKQSN